MKYIKGRSNLAATIFIPVDCKNKCTFCTSKDMYSKVDKNLDEILKKIEHLNNNDMITEYVITGGEPTSDLDVLKKIVDACNKTVYINTTLPNNNLDNAIEFINKNSYKIRGINISRHIGYKFNNVATIEDIKRIRTNKKINTVITDKFNINVLEDFINYYGSEDVSICIRGDYRNIDDKTLRNRDDMVNHLLTIGENIGNGGCMVCNENEFFVNGVYVSYHRGLEHSSFIVGDKCFVNDIIILPDGKMYKDWIFDQGEDLAFNEFMLR